jgi:hypothetical protein
MRPVIHFSKIDVLCWLTNGTLPLHRRDTPLITQHREQTTCPDCIALFIYPDKHTWEF